MADPVPPLLTGAVVFGGLAVFGIDPPSLGAAMFGCVAVQTLMPPEKPNWIKIGSVTAGSMILASFLSPWVAPWLQQHAPVGMPAHHVKASASFLIALWPQPVVLGLRVAVRAAIRKLTGATDADLA